MIRTSTGALRTSPIPSLLTESGQLPLRLLVVFQIGKLAMKLLEQGFSRQHPLIKRASDVCHSISGKSLPETATINRVGPRNWNSIRPCIDWSLYNEPRIKANKEQCKALFLSLNNDRFQNCIKIFTDGSFKDDKSGCGVFGPNLCISSSVPTPSSSFSAEAYGILLATKLAPPSNEVVIYTDSASCLLDLESGRSKHSFIQDIENAVTPNIIYCWVPGHSDISGNEKADRLANIGLAKDNPTLPSPRQDNIRWLKNAIINNWSNEWYLNRDAFFRKVKNTTLPWIDRKNVSEQRVLSRLRIGHTRVTHSHLLDSEQAPLCPTCNESITVEHLIIDCRRYDQQRAKYNIPHSIREALFNDETMETQLISFLKDCNLFKVL